MLTKKNILAHVQFEQWNLTMQILFYIFYISKQKKILLCSYWAWNFNNMGKLPKEQVDKNHVQLPYLPPLEWIRCKIPKQILTAKILSIARAEPPLPTKDQTKEQTKEQATEQAK